MKLETMYSELDGAVATIVLNRPPVLNCANEQWARDLNTIVDDLASNERLRLGSSTYAPETSGPSIRSITTAIIAEPI